MTDPAKASLYKRIAHLNEISPAGIDTLFEAATQRQLLKGGPVLEQGQVCKSIWLVQTGSLRTFMDHNGTEINTDFTFEGSFTTNLKSLRSSTPSDTTIQAGEPATVFEFDKDRLLQLYQVSPEIESFGRMLLEQLLIAQEDHANLFKRYSPAERYRHIETTNPELLQRVSLSQLASYLGMARETLSRIRKNRT